MKNGILYRAISPSGKIYVGITCKTLEKRISQHFRYASNPKSCCYNTKFSKAIRKYGNLIKWETLYENIQYDDLKWYEIYFILFYNSYKKGYNSTFGGQGTLGTKRKGIKTNNLYFLGKHHSEDTKIKMSIKQNSKKKKVYQYSKNGKTYIRSFNSIKDAVKFVKENTDYKRAVKQNIKRCCDGLCNSVYGFNWK